MIKYQELVAKTKQSDQSIVDEVVQQAYYDIPKEKIAGIISECHGVKVTDRLIEKYVELAAKRNFSIDPVVLEIRKENKLENILFEQRIEFVLDDSSTIIITEESFNLLQETLAEQPEAVAYMNTSKDAFMRIFNVIKNYKEE